ncbi:MAG: tetratricopeptide repeat protein [Thermotogae bacterium]|nr:tetratricopeptide repeat protein [Thermotogota bacterium]
MRMGRLIPVAAPLLFGACANPNFGAYFNTYYNIQQLVRRIEKLEREGDTLRLKPKYDSLELKAAYLIKYYPNSKYLPDAIFYLGLAFSRKGEYEKAAEKFREFLTYFPNHPLAERARIELARVYALDPRFRDRVLDALGDVRTNEALYWLAYARHKSGDNEAAARYLSQMRDLKPDDPLYRKYLLLGVDVYLALKDFRKAEEFLERYLALDLKPSERKLAEEKRGDLLMMMGKYDEALKVYTSIDLPPNSEDAGRVAFKVAKIRLVEGDTAGALKELEKVEKSSSEYKWDAMLLIGRLKILQGDYNGAAIMFDRVFKNAPDRWKERAYQIKLILDEWKRLKFLKEPYHIYRRAEILYFYLGKTEAAESLWTYVADSLKDSTYAPKALYALIYINLLRGDTAKALIFKERLRDEYPKSGLYPIVSKLLGI